jgi:Domain of unknown function (DUF397)
MLSDNSYGTSWRKSSYSAANGDCVEVGQAINGYIGVRDSKDAPQPTLSFTFAGWRTFVGEVKRSTWNVPSPSTPTTSLPG